MAKGCAVFIETIRDQAGYDGYLPKAVPTRMKYGGSVAVAATDAEVVEGEWPGATTVNFESVSAGWLWYRSPE